MNLSHFSQDSGTSTSSISLNAPQTREMDDWSHSRYVSSSFIAASWTMNSIKSCIHSPLSDRRSIRDSLCSFCNAVWNWIGEVIKVASERNAEETRVETVFSNVSCGRSHSLAPSTIMDTGIFSGSRNERTFKRLL